ncbi:MAG: ABC transporter ATP-binding protein [Alphaproteobacteria bacterium]|uniref:ABC transporter ATP-binding protein n=1 Tax=Candidatus Nitrobium versatile TaxID=2884831 RepID=A0A953M0W0_9BACT|nr:ABC transporter ATP-binding protein [Candidatus Nitrobium versatile]
MSKGNFGEVRIEDVTKVYEKEGTRHMVLQDCTLHVPRGKLTVLMGPSGCGKTVLVNLIAGYEKPTSGHVRIDGTGVTGPGPDRLVVFQETALFPWMTVYSNVVFGCSVQGVPKKEIREKAELILKKVGLYEFRDKYPSQLSGGMQRRAELARAMINDPKIMILDEPFRGLDAMTRQLMQEFYVGLFEEVGRTNLFITHEIDEAIFLADRLVIMTYQPGKIKAEIEVDLPRPREFHLLASSRFMEIREQAIDLLYEEAAKAFSAGSKAAYDLVGALVAQKGACKPTCKPR